MAQAVVFKDQVTGKDVTVGHDLVGSRYGDLRVTAFHSKDRKRQNFWVLTCDGCGQNLPHPCKESAVLSSVHTRCPVCRASKKTKVVQPKRTNLVKFASGAQLWNEGRDTYVSTPDLEAPRKLETSIYGQARKTLRVSGYFEYSAGLDYWEVSCTAANCDYHDVFTKDQWFHSSTLKSCPKCGSEGNTVRTENLSVLGQKLAAAIVESKFFTQDPVPAENLKQVKVYDQQQMKHLTLYLRENLKGKRLGKYRVNSFHTQDAKLRNFWWVVCECGFSKSYEQELIEQNQLPVCGCIQPERPSTPEVLDIPPAMLEAAFAEAPEVPETSLPEMVETSRSDEFVSPSERYRKDQYVSLVGADGLTYSVHQKTVITGNQYPQFNQAGTLTVESFWGKMTSTQAWVCRCSECGKLDRQYRPALLDGLAFCRICRGGEPLYVAKEPEVKKPEKPVLTPRSMQALLDRNGDSVSLKENLNGQTFGNFQVVGYSHKVRNDHYWFGQCLECNDTAAYKQSDLKRGDRKCLACQRRGAAQTKPVAPKRAELSTPQQATSTVAMKAPGGVVFRFYDALDECDVTLPMSLLGGTVGKSEIVQFHHLEADGNSYWKAICGCSKEFHLSTKHIAEGVNCCKACR